MGAVKKQVMDVNKPGKAVAPATARPVIVGHGAMVQDPMVRRAQTDDDAAAADPLLDSRPKRDHMVVKPLTGTDSERDADIKSRLSGAGPAAPADADPAGDAVDDAADNTNPAGEPAAEPDVFATAGEDVTAGVDPDAAAGQEPASASSQDKPAASPSSSRSDKSSSDKKAFDKPKSDTKNDKPKNAAGDDTGDDAEVPETSEAASIDAVVSQASSKKVAQDQEAKRREQDAAIQKLVDDKTYFVHVSQPKSHGALKYALLGIVTLVLLAVLYVGVDAGVFGNSVKVPFHVLPQTDTTSDAPANTSTAAPQQTQTATTKQTESSSATAPATTATKLSQFTSKDLGLNFSYPTAWGQPVVAQSNLNTTGTESVKTYKITFPSAAGTEIRVTPSSWTSSLKSPAVTPMTDATFQSMHPASLSAPYLSVSTTDDSYIMMAYTAKDSSVQLRAAKKLTLRTISAQYVELYTAPVTGDTATTCTTAAKTSSGVATRVPTRQCYSDTTIQDVQNVVASMKAS